MMSDLDILECSQAVYNFLIIDEWHLINVVGGFNKLPHYKEMLEVLETYKMGDMISFTHYLNDRYKKKIYTQKLLSKFSNFFKNIKLLFLFIYKKINNYYDYRKERKDTHQTLQSTND